MERRCTELVETLQRRHGSEWQAVVLRGAFEVHESMRRLCEAYCLRPDLEYEVLQAATEQARSASAGGPGGAGQQPPTAPAGDAAEPGSDRGGGCSACQKLRAAKGAAAAAVLLPLEAAAARRSMECSDDACSTSDGETGSAATATSEWSGEEDEAESSSSLDEELFHAKWRSRTPHPQVQGEVEPEALQRLAAASSDDGDCGDGERGREQSSADEEDELAHGLPWKAALQKGGLSPSRRLGEGLRRAVPPEGSGSKVAKVAAAAAPETSEGEEEHEVDRRLLQAARTAERQAAQARAAASLRRRKEEAVEAAQSSTEPATSTTSNISSDRSQRVRFANDSEACFFGACGCLTGADGQGCCLAPYTRSLWTKNFDGPSGHKAKRSLHNDAESCREPVDTEEQEEWEDSCDDIAELMCQPRHCLLWSPSW